MKKWINVEEMNMFAIGLFIGAIVSVAFMMNYHKADTKNAYKLIGAYENYYNKVETFIDSLDNSRELDLDDTDLCSDWGVDYLVAKDIIDSLVWKTGYAE